MMSLICIIYEIYVDFMSNRLLFYEGALGLRNLLKRSWAEISLDHLAENISVIKERSAGKTLMAIVKADAYGHGDYMIARELNRLGITFFGVSNLEEALSLKAARVSGEILILGFTPTEYAEVLAQQNITQAVFSTVYAQELSAAAASAGVTVKTHLKIDTGMGRIGFVQQQDADATDEILAVASLPGLNIEGVFTHFSVADLLDPASVVYTEEQQKAFDGLVLKLREAGLTLTYVHLQNSAGLIQRSDSLCNMVRMGISMYGLAPSNELVGRLAVQPLMELKTTIAMIKEIPAGRFLSYGRTFESKRPMRVATVPIGYADGYRRGLSNKAVMLLHGKAAPVLGTVCMDQLILDVTDIPEAKAGDIVTVFGRSEDKFLSVEELATLSDTIGYEIVCGISRRVPRVYIRNGEPVETVDYLLPSYTEL